MDQTLTYRSKNGQHYFAFRFHPRNGTIEISCTRHPSFNGRSSDPVKTHLFRSGELCFASGQEPRTVARAKSLAAQWAEYFLDYLKTGKVQH